jgi:hypothetical protein
MTPNTASKQLMAPAGIPPPAPAPAAPTDPVPGLVTLPGAVLGFVVVLPPVPAIVLVAPGVESVPGVEVTPGVESVPDEVVGAPGAVDPGLGSTVVPAIPDDVPAGVPGVTTWAMASIGNARATSRVPPATSIFMDAILLEARLAPLARTGIASCRTAA